MTDESFLPQIRPERDPEQLPLFDDLPVSRRHDHFLPTSTSSGVH